MVGRALVPVVVGVSMMAKTPVAMKPVLKGVLTPSEQELLEEGLVVKVLVTDLDLLVEAPGSHESLLRTLVEELVVVVSLSNLFGMTFSILL